MKIGHGHMKPPGAQRRRASSGGFWRFSPCSLGNSGVAIGIPIGIPLEKYGKSVLDLKKKCFFNCVFFHFFQVRCTYCYMYMICFFWNVDIKPGNDTPKTSKNIECCSPLTGVATSRCCFKHHQGPDIWWHSPCMSTPSSLSALEIPSRARPGCWSLKDPWESNGNAGGDIYAMESYWS